MNRGLVIAGGELDHSAKNALSQLAPNTITIGVDRGIGFFLQEGVDADYYMGDLDSIDPALIDSIPKERLMQFPADKNASDLELALDLCLELKLEYVEIFGGTGSRWDHSFSNLLSLDRYRRLGLQIIMKNRKNQAWALPKHSIISVETIQSYAYLSILPISPEGIVVSIHGVKYPLDHETLAFGKTRGVSNEGIDEEVTIHIEQGTAILVLSSD